MKKMITILLVTLLVSATAFGQSKKTIALLSIDTKNMELDIESMTDLVRIELEKTGKFEVMDKYDMKDHVAKNNIEFCYGKTCLVEVGKILNVDYMLTGNVDRISEKIVISLRLINVKESSVEKSVIKEFVNLEEYLQSMVNISINMLLGIENEVNLVDRLSINTNVLDIPQSTLRLNGPRVGAAFISGQFGKQLMAPESQGGYGGLPVLTQFGYQFETQYISTGNFQALIEYVVMFSGMEQGMFVPSLLIANGFRSNKSGWEFAFGPTFSLKRETYGFIDDKGLLGEKGAWRLANENNYYDETTETHTTYGYENDMFYGPDSRGDVSFAAGWVWSAGKTFRSGNLNIPVNIYISPKKSGWYYGTSVGFNINKKKNR